MTITSGSASNFKPAPAGNHLARCIRVIDLGTQDETYKGKPKKVQQIMIGWELVLTKMDDGRPFMVSRIYTKSLNERANLRSDLENWRGQDFTEEEAKAFDERKLLGRACMVQVQHVTKQGKTKAKISAISKIPEGMPKAPPPVNDVIYFSLEPDLHDRAAFEKLTDWTKDKVRLSPEWKALQSGPGGADERAPASGDRVNF